MLVDTKYKFSATGGFFRDVRGTIDVNEEHNIGVSTSGNKDNVLIKYLHCEVSVREPLPYFSNGHLDPFVSITWHVNYHVWSRSKGTWGTRYMRQGIHLSYVEQILGTDVRISLENELLMQMYRKCNEGTKAVVAFNRLTGRENTLTYDYEDKCKQCGSHFSEAHFPVCSLSDGYNVND